MNMTRATRQIRPARIPNQESSAPIRVPSPLQAALANARAVFIGACARVVIRRVSTAPGNCPGNSDATREFARVAQNASVILVETGVSANHPKMNGHIGGRGSLRGERATFRSSTEAQSSQ